MEGDPGWMNTRKTDRCGAHRWERFGLVTGREGEKAPRPGRPGGRLAATGLPTTAAEWNGKQRRGGRGLGRPYRLLAERGRQASQTLQLK